MASLVLLFVASTCSISSLLIPKSIAFPICLDVKTESGMIHGLYVPKANVVQFLGVPYAAPPTGSNRFMPPAPVQPWSGLRNATEFANRCPQNPRGFPSNITRGGTDEDCLYLNIYRPSDENKQNLTVMLWIHGGGLYVGSGNEVDGSILAAHNDVIVVTINYRLGLLGYLYHPGSDLRGNYGMLDQVQALKWVQKNIANFGGNPNAVTIFGKIAGSSCVAFHLLSPLSKGLFHRAIMESGAAVSPFSFYSALDTNFDLKFINKLGCHDVLNFRNCLKGKKVKDFLKLYTKANPMRLGLDYPVVTIDGNFLPWDPRRLLKYGRINAVSVIQGINKDEGSLFLQEDMINKKYYENFIKDSVFTINGDSPLTKEAIFYKYTDPVSPDSNPTMIKNRQNLLGDAWFNSPAIYTINALSARGIPTHFYVFSHRMKFSIYPESFGVNSFDEIPFVFGFPLQRTEKFVIATDYTDMERGLSSYMMKLWSNFAKSGNPTGGEQSLLTWPLYTTEKKQHLEIGLEPRVGSHYRAEAMAFWHKLVSAIERMTSYD